MAPVLRMTRSIKEKLPNLIFFHLPVLRYGDRMRVCGLTKSMDLIGPTAFGNHVILQRPRDARLAVPVICGRRSIAEYMFCRIVEGGGMIIGRNALVTSSALKNWLDRKK